MTIEFHDDSERPQPLGLGSSEGLGLAPEREGQPHQYTATGPGPEAGHWYSPAAVREMLAAERDRWREINAMAARLEQMTNTLADENERLKAKMQDQIAGAQSEIDRLHDLLIQIGNIAHNASTGPAVHDVLWEIRGMAYGGVGA